MAYLHVIFDLDGTLVDSTKEIHAAACSVCEKFSLPLPSSDYIRSATGQHPLRFFSDHGAESDSLLNECVQLFREHLLHSAGDPALVLPGVVSLLEYLTCQNIRISCATTKPTLLAETLLGRYRLGKYFAHVQGTDPSMNCKPAPDVIQACLVKAKGLTALMVGDTVLDIKAARAAAIDCAAVATGADTLERLREERPAHLFPHISHVGKLF